MPATRPLPWQFWLLAALGVAVAIGLLFVAFTVAIFLLPVVLVVVLWQRWVWSRRIRTAMTRAQQARQPTIDADYVVVDEGKPRN